MDSTICYLDNRSSEIESSIFTRQEIEEISDRISRNLAKEIASQIEKALSTDKSR